MTHSFDNLPPLESLRAFEAAARKGSFSAAAEALNLTHGAVSRQVAKLEHWLGHRVFERQARGVALTPNGRSLYERAAEAFALIADTSDRWPKSRGSSVVRLTCIPSVGGLWLMPRLRRLETGTPSLSIELSVEHRSIDLEAEGVDLAIRCGRGALPERVSVRLFEEFCFPVASPELARRIGEGPPERLLAQPLLHDTDAGGWRAWFRDHGLDFQVRPIDRRFEDYNLVLEAAANGLGIALARPPMAQGAIATGRLVRVDARTVVNPVSYWLDRPARQPRPSAAELARRIMAEAGVPEAAATAFLRTSGG